MFAARLAADRWFCWEQPDRDGFAHRGRWGAPTRSSRAAPAGSRTWCRRAPRSPGGASPTSRPACPPAPAPCGSAASPSMPRGRGKPHWSSFPPALLVLPEVVFHRLGGRDAHDPLRGERSRGDAHEVGDRLAARVAALREGPLPLVDPHPTGAVRIASASPPGRYEASVAAAVERIRAGELDKVVLAREVTVEAPRAHDPAALYGALRELFPSCFCFCCGSPEGAFLGASPELLVRRSGAGAATVGLAGSTRRSADPSVDDHLGEQLLRSPRRTAPSTRSSSDRIERALRPLLGLGRGRRRAGAGQGGEHPAPRRPRSTPSSRSRARRSSSPGCCIRRPPSGASRASGRSRRSPSSRSLDRGWYAGPGRLDGRRRGRRVLRRPPQRSAARPHRPPFAGAGIVADSRPRRRACRDRAEARRPCCRSSTG